MGDAMFIGKGAVKVTDMGLAMNSVMVVVMVMPWQL